MDTTGIYDDLTGLYNRKGLHTRFAALPGDTSVQILFLDLDNFKTVNDMYGHALGDETLHIFAELLRTCAPENAILSRLGGDEFIIVIPEFYTRDAIAMVGDKILKAVRGKRNDHVAFGIISTSIGIVWDETARTGLDALVNDSDAAMYLAKEYGKNNYVFFDDHEGQIVAEKNMEMQAAQALKEQTLIVRYRPVIHLQSTRLTRARANCLWRMDDDKLIDRTEYGAVLEKYGIIKDIDLFAFEQVCRDLSLFREKGRAKVPVSVSMSYLLILQEDFVETLLSIMEPYGVEPADFEITLEESAFAKRGISRLIDHLNRVHDAGFSICVNRFGMDFSSFRYLRELPIAALAFDEQFIRSSMESVQGKRVLNTLFSLGRDFKLLIASLGVDNAEDVMLLSSIGCDIASGRYYGGYYDAKSFAEFISANDDTEGVSYSFPFQNNLFTEQGNYSGQMIGEDVEFVDGISDVWGGIKFPGGEIGTNLVSFPSAIMPQGSHTTSFWIKPFEIQNWISAFFVRYNHGFEAIMPSVSGGMTIYRRHPDGDEEIWDDVLVGGIPMRKWTFVTAVYDAFNAQTRLYLNGEAVGHKMDVTAMSEVSLIYLGGDVFQSSFRGVISALQIYAGAKSADEIKELYDTHRAEANFHGDEEAAPIEEYVVHDPAIYEDRERGRFYLYTTEGYGFVSRNIVHWEPLGRIVTGVDKEAQEWTGSYAIWAPDIVKVEDEYRLYCSNSSFGVQRSCIFLATSKSPAGPFIPKAPVLKTDETLGVNGIDANIITDHDTGEQYLLYGSFWGGIHLLPLDRFSGLARDAGADGSGVGSLKLKKDYHEGMQISDISVVERERRQGICIARRPEWTSGAIEGAYMIYHEDTGYYYLFVSYGSLKSDYNIRVARSRKVTGPFLDYHFHTMTDIDDSDCTRGLMISCGYKWLTGLGMMAPGHNSVLQRENGDLYLVNHIRKQHFCEENPGSGFLQIRRLYITPDGWPIAAAQPYREEAMNRVRDEVIPGVYERIELKPSVPQGIMHAHPMELLADGRLEICSVIGTWRRTGDYSLELTYGDITEYVCLEKGLDAESERTTVLLSGLTGRGICTWAKKKNYI